MAVILKRIGWENKPSKKTPANASNFIKMENNTQEAVTELEELLKTKIITGKEVGTNEYIDDKQVYCKRIDCGNLPTEDSIKEIDTGIDVSTINVIRIEGTATNNINEVIPLNTHFNNFLQVGMILNSNGKLRIRSNDNRSEYHGYANIYYTKK